VLEITCIEGEPFTLEPGFGGRLRAACEHLQKQLRPSFPILSEDRGQFVIQGVIGSIGMGAMAVLEISPKIAVGDDWVHAVLELLIGSDRIDAVGERAAAMSPHRRSLLEALAAIYAARLERALLRDGPILILQREQRITPFLRGKLNVTRWLRRAVWQPHRFPVSFDLLTSDNDFSRAIAMVAGILATASRSPGTRAKLMMAARAIRPGFPEEIEIPSAVVARRLPSQWGVYEPVWSIATAIIAHRSILGASGRHRGVSIAIEAWPLLERLLERSLASAVNTADGLGRKLELSPKVPVVLLDKPFGSAERGHSVVPDGRLTEGEETVATFEAKYKRRSGANAWPSREDLYQALATAAASNSPLAVLVYPESFPPAWWTVKNMHGRPGRLAAIGLGLFSYRAGAGDEERGQSLLRLLTQTHGSANSLEMAGT
jgi:hypothetical protein